MVHLHGDILAAHFRAMQVLLGGLRVLLAPELDDGRVFPAAEPDLRAHGRERAKWAEEVVQLGVGEVGRELLDDTRRGGRGRQGGRVGGRVGREPYERWRRHA